MNNILFYLFLLINFVYAGPGVDITLSGGHINTTPYWMIAVGITTYYSYRLKTSYGVVITIFWLIEMLLFLSMPFIIIAELITLILAGKSGHKKFLEEGGIDIIKVFKGEKDIFIPPKTPKKTIVNSGRKINRRKINIDKVTRIKDSKCKKVSNYNHVLLQDNQIIETDPNNLLIKEEIDTEFDFSNEKIDPNSLLITKEKDTEILI